MKHNILIRLIAATLAFFILLVTGAAIGIFLIGLRAQDFLEGFRK